MLDPHAAPNRMQFGWFILQFPRVAWRSPISVASLPATEATECVIDECARPWSRRSPRALRFWRNPKVGAGGVLFTPARSSPPSVAMLRALRRVRQ
jgi:hypothetical protein